MRPRMESRPAPRRGPAAGSTSSPAQARRSPRQRATPATERRAVRGPPPSGSAGAQIDARWGAAPAGARPCLPEPRYPPPLPALHPTECRSTAGLLEDSPPRRSVHGSRSRRASRTPSYPTDGTSRLSPQPRPRPGRPRPDRDCPAGSPPRGTLRSRLAPREGLKTRPASVRPARH